MKREFKNFSSKNTIKKLIGGKHSFLLRKGSEADQIIFSDQHMLFATENRNFPVTKLFLFGLVNKDVKKYINDVEDIYLPIKKKTQFYNLDYDESYGILTGTDLDHAYWRVAYVKGYISEKTYLHGLKDNDAKSIRLATLGVLGTEQKYDRYVDGEYKETIVVRAEHPLMKKIYQDIRLSCYWMMFELSENLGNDFESWGTDCIYYRDTPENRQLVFDYFDKENMLYKQLVFDDEELEKL